MRSIPGFESLKAFADHVGLGLTTVHMHMTKGKCRWPRGVATAGRRSNPHNVLYRNIKARTTDKNNPQYADYGGRGIKMCTAWYVSFEQFAKDIAALGPKPHKYTLDRIDNSKGYEPDNVKWSSYTEQNNNRRPRRRG